MFFTVEVEMYEGSWGDGRFSFEAENEKDALEKAQTGDVITVIAQV